MFVVALLMVFVLSTPISGVEYANSSDERESLIIEDFRSLMNAVARNETETFAKFIEAITKSGKRSEEAFNTTKDELRLVQKNGAFRRHNLSKIGVDGGHAATFKRESDAQPVEQGEVSAVQRALDVVGFVGRDLTTMNEKELIVAFTVLASKFDQLNTDYKNVKDPILVRCEIDWFEDQYGQGFQLNGVDQKAHDNLKKDPAAQRVFLREKRWIHILTNKASAEEVKFLLERMEVQKIKITVMANAIGNLFEVIANTIIHALKLGKRTDSVTIMNKQPFDQCASVLIEVAPKIPSCVKPSKTSGKPGKQ